MFTSSKWKQDVLSSIEHLEGRISDLQKSETDLRSAHFRLQVLVKNLGKKLVNHLPISLESLEKSLAYDLVFAEEIDAWRHATQQGTILDLRAAHEVIKACIPGAVNIPYDQLSLRMENLPKDQPVLLVCDNGIKSVAACELLTSKGYSFIYVLKGGMSHYRELMSDSPEPVNPGSDKSAREAYIS